MSDPYDPNIDDDASPEAVAAWFNRSPADIQAAKDADWQARWRALRTPDDQAYETDTPSATPTAGDDVGAAQAESATPPMALDPAAYPEVEGPSAPPLDPSQPNYGLEPWPGDPGYTPPAFATEGGDVGGEGNGRAGQAAALTDDAPAANSAPAEAAPTGEAVDAAVHVKSAQLPAGGKIRGGIYTAPTVGTLPPEANALYDAITRYEAGEDGIRYRIPKGADAKGRPIYEGHSGRLVWAQGEKPNYDVFPDKFVSYEVTHAGAPQFSRDTWLDLKARHPDLENFSLLNRRKALWYAANEEYYRTAKRDLTKDIKDPANYPLITKKLVGKWPSLPGGPQAQRENTQASFNQRMADGT